MQNVFSVDGRYFNIIIPEKGIKRSFSVADTDKAGRALTGRMIRDIIGTFYNYTIEFKTNRLSKQEYDELYEIISSPVESHRIVVPYGQDTLIFEAYITSGEDTCTITDNGIVWDGMSINLIAIEPKRIPGGA